MKIYQQCARRKITVCMYKYACKSVCVREFGTENDNKFPSGFPFISPSAFSLYFFHRHIITETEGGGSRSRTINAIVVVIVFCYLCDFVLAFDTCLPFGLVRIGSITLSRHEEKKNTC